jgi:hypothetical protein
MMSTILIVALILVLAIILALMAPFHLLAEFAVSSEARNGTFLVHLIHPRFAGMRYDFAHNHIDLMLFGKRFKTFAREADVREKSGKPADSGTLTGTAKKEPVAKEPVRQSAKPSEPTTNASPEPFSSSTGGHQSASSGPTTRNRFAQFRTRMLSHWRKFQATWHILHRHHMASRAFRWCMRLFSACLRVVRFDHVRINVQAGMEDPAELGKLCGWFVAGSRLLFGNRKNIALRFEPLFMQRRLAFDGSVGLRTSAAMVLMPVAIALITFPWLRAFFVWRRLKTVYHSRLPGDIIS